MSLNKNMSSLSPILELVDTLNGLWRFLLKRWWVLFIGGFVGGSAGVLYAYMQPPKYQSTLTFALEDNGGALSGAFSLAAEFGLNLGGTGKDVFAGENILAILTSRRIVENVLLSKDTINGKKLTLADRYLSITKKDKGLTNHPRLGTIRFPADQPRQRFSYLQDSILYSLYTDITKNALIATKPDRKLNIYKVEFVSADENFSKVFTERLVAEANRFYTDLRSRRSLQTLQVLESRVAAMKGAARSAIRGRAAVQDANVNPAYAEQDALLQAQSIDITAYGSAYGELFKNMEIARYQYLKDVPLMQIIDEPRLPMKNLKKGRLKTGLVFAFLFAFATSVCLIISYFLLRFRRDLNQLRLNDQASSV